MSYFNKTFVLILLFSNLHFIQSDMKFSLISDYNPWAGRSGPYLHILQNTLVYNSTFYPIGSLLLYGGSNDIHLHSVINDTWLSSDHGSSWLQLAGPGVGPDGSIFPTLPFCTFCSDPLTDRSYVISNNDYNYRRISPLWTSITQSNWTSYIPIAHNVSVSNSPFIDRYAPICMVDSNSTLYYLGGINNTLSNRQPYKDIWWSTDQGRTWDLRIETLKLVNESRPILTGVHIKNVHLQGRDILYMIGSFDDVWISSDQSQTWNKISTGPWRGDISASKLHITKDGILVANIYAFETLRCVSNIWTSLNGGYTWNLCLQNAAYGCRYLPGMVVDMQGFIYIVGGMLVPRPQRDFPNDVWKSSLSVYDWETWASACGTTVPIGGVGLQKWPDESSSSSSSSSSTGSCNLSSSSALTSSSSHSYSSTNTYTSSSSLISSSDRPVESSSSSTGTLHILDETNWGLWAGLITGILAVITLIGILLYLRYLKRRYGRIQWFCCRTRYTSDSVNNRLLGSEL